MEPIHGLPRVLDLRSGPEVGVNSREGYTASNVNANMIVYKTENTPGSGTAGDILTNQKWGVVSCALTAVPAEVLSSHGRGRAGAAVRAIDEIIASHRSGKPAKIYHTRLERAAAPTHTRTP